MNPLHVSRWSPSLPQLLRSSMVTLLCTAASAHAVDFYWDANGNTEGTGGTGVWTTNTNRNQRRWRTDSTTGTLGSWNPASRPDDWAIFGGAAGTVSLNQNVSLNGLRFLTDGYLLQNNTITLAGANPTITADTSVTAQINSILAGATTTTGLIKDGAGTLTLTAVNSYTGVTEVRAGTLRLGGASDIDVINRESAVILTGGTLDLGDFTEDTGLFTLRSGRVTGGTGAALGVNTTAALAGQAFSMESGTVDVVLQNPKYPVGTDSAAVGLTKSTAGTVTLSRANTYTGATSITGGTLVLTGSIAQASTVTVSSGATLAGTGNAYGNVTLNGILSPGVGGVGRLSTGAERWNTGSGYDFNIWSATGAAGSAYDTVSINGALNLTGLGTGGFALKVIGLVSPTGAPGPITSFTGSMANPAGYTWTLVTASSGITGFDAGKFTVDLSRFANPYTGDFSVRVAGNNLNLVFTPVPEPATAALALGGATLGMVALCRYRNRRPVAV